MSDYKQFEKFISLLPQLEDLGKKAAADPVLIFEEFIKLGRQVLDKSKEEILLIAVNKTKEQINKNNFTFTPGMVNALNDLIVFLHSNEKPIKTKF
jgi:hypothetical protein